MAVLCPLPGVREAQLSGYVSPVNEAPEIDFSCCFCGGARKSNDPITVTASWVEADGLDMWQAWGAHRQCLIEKFSEMARWSGGPIFGQDDPESWALRGDPPLGR